MADTLIKSLVSRLTAAIGITGSVYDRQVPPTASSPYVVLRRSSTNDTTHMRGAVGEAQTIVEVACVADSADDSSSLANAVRASLHGRRFNGDDGLIVYSSVMDGDVAENDTPPVGEGLGVYARIMRFAMWHNVSIPSYP